MSATDLQAQGQQAYKRGDFAKALEFFSRALGRQQTVKLYDYRAATHDKLNDHPAALQDAKKAIQTGNADPTGYLRAGDVLIKMKKPAVALEIYAHGLRQVQHVGQGYERLKKVHDDLQAELSPRTSVDPMTRLPRELACMVLEYLNFRQRIAICRVSKGWQKFVRSEPTLWQHLDLIQTRKKVPTRFISTAINTAKGKLNAATLSRLYDYDKALVALTKHCPLEKLTLAEIPLQGQVLIDALGKAKHLKELRILSGAQLPSSLFPQAVAACQQTLEALQCSGPKTINFGPWDKIQAPRLLSLDIRESSLHNTTTRLGKFLANCPLLHTLRLHGQGYHEVGGDGICDFREFTSLRHVDLRLGIRESRQLLLPASIRTLHISATINSYAGFWPNGAAALEDATELRLLDLPELEEFQLAVPNTPVEEVRRQLASQHIPPRPDSSLSKLRVLSLFRPSISATMTSDPCFPERTKELEVLKIQECHELQDKHILTLVKNFPKLRTLDVSSTRVTGAGIKDIVLLGHLKELVLNNCHDLNRDAVDWARKQGVKVQCLMNNEGVGGKKVKY